jgi:hypothetical protein
VQRVIIPSRATPIPLEPHPEQTGDQPKAHGIGPFARGRTSSTASTASSAVTSFSWAPERSLSSASMEDDPLPLTTPLVPHQKKDTLSDSVSTPLAAATGNSHRGILRRSASGSLLTGKRVTIQSQVPGSPLHSGEMCTSPTVEAPNPMTSPRASTLNSPAHDLTRQLQALNLSTSAGGRSESRGRNGELSPTEEDVLRMMAAAQM